MTGTQVKTKPFEVALLLIFVVVCTILIVVIVVSAIEQNATTVIDQSIYLASPTETP